MGHHLNNLILEGEHQTQDFKYAITDSKKIARTLAAFANTEGGRLLVGVKDNGRVAGVSSEEEYYMIEAAAEMYCKPPVLFEAREWDYEGKKVVEITVPKSKTRPHKAPSNNGRYKVYVRVNDQNLLANGVLLKVWARQKRTRGTFFELKEPEQKLLTFLNTQEPSVTLSKFSRMAGISRQKAEQILVNLIAMEIIEIQLTEKGAFYRLKELEKGGKREAQSGKREA